MRRVSDFDRKQDHPKKADIFLECAESGRWHLFAFDSCLNHRCEDTIFRLWSAPVDSFQGRCKGNPDVAGRSAMVQNGPCTVVLEEYYYLVRLPAPLGNNEPGFDYPICFSRISSSVLQSIQRVAVGLASKRRIPISMPHDSQYP